MNISKNNFRDFIECPTLYYYFNKKNKISDNEDDKLKIILNYMLNEDSISDMNSKLRDILKPYGFMFMKRMLVNAKKTFNQEFEDTKKLIEYTNNNLNLYAYIDGYSNNKKEIVIDSIPISSDLIESTNIFEISNNIYSIKSLSDNTFDINNIFNIIRNSKLNKYVYDIACIKYILNKNGNDNNISYYIAIMNSNFVMNNNIQDIVFVDVTLLLTKYLKVIENDYFKLEKLVNKKDSEAISKEVFKSKCLNCENIKKCHSFITKTNNITKLLDASIDEINDYINNNITCIKDIPLNQINKQTQLIQRNSIVSKQEFINYNNIKKHLSNLQYPLYYLNLDSIRLLFPRYEGEKPYANDVFTYTIYREPTIGVCDENRNRLYYMPLDFTDYRERLITSLVHTVNLAEGGTVVVYDLDDFSKKIDSMIEYFPAYKDKLNNLRKHTIGLSTILKDNDVINYYLYNQNGDYSLNSIINSLVPNYFNKMNISNRNDAVIGYAKFRDISFTEFKSVRENVVSYYNKECYAMHIIIDYLRRRV